MMQNYKQYLLDRKGEISRRTFTVPNNKSPVEWLRFQKIFGNLSSNAADIPAGGGREKMKKKSVINSASDSILMS